MNVPHDAEAKGEQRRKDEAIESLVADLCEGPPDNVSSVLRTALERGWIDEVQAALRIYEAKKQGEISRICNWHYTAFIGSAEELLKMRKDLADLRGQVCTLSDEIEDTGHSALSVARMLLNQRYATANIASTTAMVGECSAIVSMIMDAFVHIHEKRYYSALNTMDFIDKHLQELGDIRFVSQIRSWMPSLTGLINDATKEELSEWLLNVRVASVQIGAAAMRSFAKFGNAGNEAWTAGGHPDGTGQSAVVVSLSVQCLVRLEELMGCSLRLTKREVEEFIPQFLRCTDPIAQEEEDQALESMNDYLHPVHRALHIFARLHLLDDFKTWYLEYRWPMADLTTMSSRHIDAADTASFLQHLSSLSNGIMGFFIVEDTLLRKAEHKEGLLSPQQIENAWRRSLSSLRGLVEQYVGTLVRPGHFLQLKASLLAMANLAPNLDLDKAPIMELLRKLRDPYQKLLLLAFEGECRRMTQEESYQPLEVRNTEEYNSFIQPLGLHEAGTEQGLDFTMMIDDASLMNPGGVRTFPITYAFSATVPELGLTLVKLASLMAAFLAHMEVREAGAMVIGTLERGVGVIRQIMLEQLQSAETDMHILKASQISINSAFMSRMPSHLGSVLWDSLAALQFADAAHQTYEDTNTSENMSDMHTGAYSSAFSPQSGTVNNTGVGSPGGAFLGKKEQALKTLAAAGRAVEGISDRARDLIFELVRKKADELLADMEFVKWEPAAMRQSPHTYCDDLINYLRVTLLNLSTLPVSLREAAHFTCMTHVCECMLAELLGPRCTGINILGIHNLSLDVQALINFSGEIGIQDLDACFHKLSHLLDIILKNQADVMLDPDRRAEIYPRLDARHLVGVLEKYKNLSLAAKIRNTVGDEVPQLDQKYVKKLVLKLSTQLG